LKIFKSIISGFAGIAIAISLCAPAYAVDFGGVVNAMQVVPDFGSWVWSAFKTGNSSFKFLTGDKNYCPGSGEQPGFNYRHDFTIQDTIVDGKAGTYYICKNCGMSAGEVLEPAYDDYVQDLPSTGYDSSGDLHFRLIVNRFEGVQKVSIDASSCGSSFSVAFHTTKGSYSVAQGYLEEFKAPLVGNYRLIACLESSNSSVGFYRFYSSGPYHLLSGSRIPDNVSSDSAI